MDQQTVSAFHDVLTVNVLPFHKKEDMKCRKKKAPRLGRELFYNTLSLFADLVAYRAGRFASRLTRSWAFAAAAAAQGLFQHFFIDSFDSLCHRTSLLTLN